MFLYRIFFWLRRLLRPFRLAPLRRISRGFSLIELSVIISVAAAISIGFLSWTQPASITDATKNIQTKQKLFEVAQAIEAFRVSYGRLPCPADILMREDNSYATGSDLYPNDFGTEDLDSLQTTVNSVTTYGIDCPTTLGSVPIYSLGLDMSYLYDAWGKRIIYHVSDRLCGADSGADIIGDIASKQRGCSKQDYESNAGDILIKDGNENIVTPLAAFVLLSPGSNGLGGYLPSSSLLEESENILEVENHDGDKEYISTEKTGSYDDILVFRTKTQLEQLSQKKDAVLISKNRCQENSQLIDAFTPDSLQVIEGNMPDYQQRERTKSSQIALGIFLAVQEACIAYYGVEDGQIDGWDGAQCPGTGLYNETSRSCECPSGDWSQCCPDNNWEACLAS